MKSTTTRRQFISSAAVVAGAAAFPALVLAQALSARIVAVDLFPEFLAELDRRGWQTLRPWCHDPALRVTLAWARLHVSRWAPVTDEPWVTLASD
jgi:hypothetical protein